MAHKIKVLPYKTFRLNVSVTTPYNADFDGDEMNGFFGQSIQARTELDLIANVKNQIVGAKDSNPIIGCVQDGVTGAYLLTLDDVSVDSEEALYLMSRSENPKFEKIKKNKKYSGKEIFSTIIPEGINSVKKNFEVKNGELLKGSLNKSTIASKKNSLIHCPYILRNILNL